ncbi:MAG: bifunctional aldolase/short-chain dehydrogenase [Rhizobiaceae bacterium]|nr:MAG: bifunctional aldolase/short-chain dehydrogenase [Rhizobiaceae bacterium]CAG1011643.1 4-formylbenzenesulfonate dehydrogenase TsaC1/TsaC2 [Rhizobiaceae bacterium]
MKSLWNDADAAKMVADYGARGVSRDLALRIYTTRLLGGDPRLVLHGGGNTSLKTRVADLIGEEWDVLCVKGSGWDMAVIEPQGLPAVKLAPLLKARRLSVLSDEDMVALQRANLIDPSSPNPSVETLLHAFLPHRFVDHTHSTAILAIVDQGEDSEALCKEVFGPRMGYVPYIKPGFDLAKAAAEVFDRDPTVEGLILDKHGIFTFGDSAEEAYGRMIHWVTVAEDYVAVNDRPLSIAAVGSDLAAPGDIAPLLRGAVAFPRGEGAFDRFVADFRTSDRVRAFLASGDLRRLADTGVSTPDLSIRIKTGPVVLPSPRSGDLAAYATAARQAIANYVAAYTDYFRTNDARDDVARTMLDPMPRLALVPGLGMFGFGRTLKDARIASDVGEMWIEAVAGAEAVGRFRPLSKPELFELEYWSLEQAKLAGNKPKPLTGQVVLVTGGGGAIGAATTKLFAANGAHVVVADADEDRAIAAAKVAGNGSIAVSCDVTDPVSVRRAFDVAVAQYGGVDIVVSNAGAAWEGGIGEIDDALLRKSFELNFFAHQSVAQNAVRIFKLQGIGGVLLFNTSKQAVNPGPKFGAYGLPKAATLFLSRQYALEYGPIGVRSNAVNADRIRSGLLTGDMIASRSKARGLTEKDYMAGNLLGLEVTAEHVAQAFLHQALAERTTADVTTVDGGNIAAALR